MPSSLLSPHLVGVIRQSLIRGADTPVYLVRNGTTIGQYTTYYQPYQLDARQPAGIVGRDPGFSFQDWRSYRFPQPAPRIQVFDDILHDGRDLLVSFLNRYQTHTEAIAWYIDYNLLIDIYNAAGVLVQAGFPAIVVPATNFETVAGAVGMQPSIDATLYCAANANITVGATVRVSSVEGVAQSYATQGIYGVRTINNRYYGGRLLECGLYRKYK